MSHESKLYETLILYARSRGLTIIRGQLTVVAAATYIAAEYK